MRKYISEQESFYLQGILNNINEQDTYFLTVNTNTWWNAELHLTNSESFTIYIDL